MKDKKLIKKCIHVGMIFILTGVIIGFTGWSMAGFKTEYFQESGKSEWYKTIHTTDEGMWFGIRFGDVDIMHFGI